MNRRADFPYSLCGKVLSRSSISFRLWFTIEFGLTPFTIEMTLGLPLEWHCFILRPACRLPFHNQHSSTAQTSLGHAVLDGLEFRPFGEGIFGQGPVKVEFQAEFRIGLRVGVVGRV
jgi:hypothetical protein